MLLNFLKKRRLKALKKNKTKAFNILMGLKLTDTEAIQVTVDYIDSLDAKINILENEIRNI